MGEVASALRDGAFVGIMIGTVLNDLFMAVARYDTIMSIIYTAITIGLGIFFWWGYRLHKDSDRLNDDRERIYREMTQDYHDFIFTVDKMLKDIKKLHGIEVNLSDYDDKVAS